MNAGLMTCRPDGGLGGYFRCLIILHITVVVLGILARCRQNSELLYRLFLELFQWFTGSYLCAIM